MPGSRASKNSNKIIRPTSVKNPKVFRRGSGQIEIQFDKSNKRSQPARAPKEIRVKGTNKVDKNGMIHGSDGRFIGHAG